MRMASPLAPTVQRVTVEHEASVTYTLSVGSNVERWQGEETRSVPHAMLGESGHRNKLDSVECET